MKNSIKTITKEILAAIPEGTEFSTLDLRREVAETLYCRTIGRSRNPFPATILRYVRYARLTGDFDYRCINRNKSLYKKERMR